jgi:restriction system protein
MSWQEFEILVGEAFRLDGYSVKETSSGADGGIDLILRKEGEQFFVQCKQWKAFKVGVTIVRELYGVMAAEGAAGGFVVTSGVYTQEAKAFAEGRNIKLIDGAKLTELIKKVQKNRHAMTSKEPVPLKTIEVQTTHQSCPKCGADMVKRLAKQGANAGQTFWGCSIYPKCKGVIPIMAA